MPAVRPTGCITDDPRWVRSAVRPIILDGPPPEMPGVGHHAGLFIVPAPARLLCRVEAMKGGGLAGLMLKAKMDTQGAGGLGGPAAQDQRVSHRRSSGVSLRYLCFMGFLQCPTRAMV